MECLQHHRKGDKAMNYDEIISNLQTIHAQQVSQLNLNLATVLSQLADCQKRLASTQQELKELKEKQK